MDYRKEKNGDLVISNAAEGEQAVIDAIMAVLKAYKANLSEKPEGAESLEFTRQGHFRVGKYGELISDD